ncbi:MAG TPA: M20/M25/M40 family metallo-hydrolase [Terriglobia bacterium]|nr:M20/M25/M40 family metallo-hydrolase [Terriglobia bacterium]
MPLQLLLMELLELTKALVNINSVTGHEVACAEFLRQHLAGRGFEVQMQPVSGQRANVFASRGIPKVVLSTHMDTVPPYLHAREDEQFIYGRGACDAKGIIAAQVTAAARLMAEGLSDFGLLFVVGEETGSDGARAANLLAPGSEYIINGEPTENRLVIGTKGILWVKIEARGKMAHSAYTELGESAIEKLLDILADLRRLPLPRDPVFGPATMNIGLISGGRAPNVIPDRADCEIMYRMVPELPEGPHLLRAIEQSVHGRAKLTVLRETPPLKMEAVEGLETRVVAFTTDLPSLGNWGRPLLIGPGTIHEAHTKNEKVAKADLTEAVEIYARLVRELLARCQG